MERKDYCVIWTDVNDEIQTRRYRNYKSAVNFISKLSRQAKSTVDNHAAIMVFGEIGIKYCEKFDW